LIDHTNSILFAVCCLLFAVAIPLSQLTTLIWLKSTLFRNSLRSSKAVVNRVASLLGMLAALALALFIALILGVAAYVLTSPDNAFAGTRTVQTNSGAHGIPSPEFIFFSIFAMCYLLWTTLPLSIGSSRQFDPGNLLLYPISLRRLFAVDFISEVASLQSMFAIPAIIAIGIGAGLAQGKLPGGILIALVAAAFGLALSKWVSTSVGSLIRKKRVRGETLVALMGAVAGLGGLLLSQLAPQFLRHAESISALRWTPPGALAFAFTHGLREGQSAAYFLSVTLVVSYTVVLIALTYWLARRAILGGGARKRRPATTSASAAPENYAGWQIPFVAPDLAAIIEKELRYTMRNAQLRMMALMPLILIIVRLMNRRHFNQTALEGNRFMADFLKYGEGFMATSGVLYVFLILSGLSCNLFAFEHSGMRTLILSPISRKRILLGKNIAICTVALVFTAGVLAINELVFRDLTPAALLFAVLSFVIFASMISVMGNWFSMRFPKRMKFGARMNVSGVVGVLLIPMIIFLALPPMASAAAGYVAQSLLIEYVTLAILAVLSVGFYLMIIEAQGESLQKRELGILEAVTDPGSD
jgi:hypothetical protein